MGAGGRGAETELCARPQPEGRSRGKCPGFPGAALLVQVPHWRGSGSRNGLRLLRAPDASGSLGAHLRARERQVAGKPLGSRRQLPATLPIPGAEKGLRLHFGGGSVGRWVEWGGWCVETGLFCSRPVTAQAHTPAVAAASLLWPESTTGKWSVFLRSQKAVSVGAGGFCRGRKSPAPWRHGLQAIPAHFSQNPASTTQAVWAMVTEVHSSLFIKITRAKVRCTQAKTSRP